VKITKHQLRRIIREARQADVGWGEDRPGSGLFYFESPTGTYMWRRTTGHLEFQSNTTGRVQRLSRPVSARRAGGFHDIETEGQATARVQSHMRRQR